MHKVNADYEKDGEWILEGMNQTYTFHTEPDSNKLSKLLKK